MAQTFVHIQNEMKNKTVAHLTLGGIISFVTHFKSHLLDCLRLEQMDGRVRDAVEMGELHCVAD